MPATPNAVLSSLADPTRRAIFERLCRDGELTVRALTDRAGVRSRRSPSIWRSEARKPRARPARGSRDPLQREAAKDLRP